MHYQADAVRLQRMREARVSNRELANALTAKGFEMGPTAVSNRLNGWTSPFGIRELSIIDQAIKFASERRAQITKVAAFLWCCEPHRRSAMNQGHFNAKTVDGRLFMRKAEAAAENGRLAELLKAAQARDFWIAARARELWAEDDRSSGRGFDGGTRLADVCLSKAAAQWRPSNTEAVEA